MHQTAIITAMFALVSSVAVAAMPPTPEGVEVTHMTFNDEFDRFISSSNGLVGWMTRYPGEGKTRALPELDGNREAEYYSDESVGHNPFSVSNGILKITANHTSPYSNPYKLPYTSGLMTTYRSFSQTFGYFEIKAKLPRGKGLWPAFWMLPVKKQDNTEIDIFEVLCDKPTVLFSTLHWHPHDSNKSVGVMKTLTVADTSADFHTYGADWEPDKVRFFIDGIQTAEIPTPAPMHTPMYMVVNLAVGAEGSWPGMPDANTHFPASLEVAYVRAFATKNTRQIEGTMALSR